MLLKNTEIIQIIVARINELKFQKVRLRPFIKSDKEKILQIDFAINEMEAVLAQSYKQKSC